MGLEKLGVVIGQVESKNVKVKTCLFKITSFQATSRITGSKKYF